MLVQQLREKIVSGEITIREAVKGYTDNIKSYNGELNAVLDCNEDAISLQIEELDRKLKSGDTSGKLFGVPILVKDSIVVKGFKTTCASKMLENFEPIYDASVIENLRNHGAIILGKTNMDEFAMGSSNETSFFGATKNPIDKEFVPGGSSGGSAAAVKAMMTPLSLGSDTGGSIRQPASMCGVCGFKPTYGRVSRYGLVTYASSLDQIGPFANNMEDLICLYNAIAGHDKKDSTSFLGEYKEVETSVNLDYAKSLKIGIPKEYFSEGLSKEVRENINERVDYLKSLGAQIFEISLPHTEFAVATYYIVATAEASSNLAKFDGVKYGYRSRDVQTLADMYCKTRSEGFGSEVKRRIMFGTYVLSAGYYDAYYLKAMKVRTLIRQDFEKAFEKVDVIVAPVTATLPFKIGEKMSDPLEMYLSDIYTISANLAGIPGLTVRAGKSGKFSVGMQILGKHYGEETVLKAGLIADKPA